MNINPNYNIDRNVKKNIGFGSGMTTKAVKYLQRATTEKVEDKLFHAYGVHADFSGNNLVAGLVNLASNICKELNMNLPRQISVCKFVQSQRKLESTSNALIVGYAYKSSGIGPNGQFLKKFSVEFNDDYFNVSPEMFDKRCDKRQKFVGDTHFLNYMIHEFVHSDFFVRTNTALKQHMYNKPGLARFLRYYLPKQNEYSDVFYNTHNLEPFREEVEKVIAPYAMENPLELQATYWTKEICKCLDSNLRPKYNPFENPAIQLSPMLRAFMTNYNNGEMRMAREIAKIAAKNNDFN